MNYIHTERMMEIISRQQHIVFIANPISGTLGKRVILNKVEKLIDTERFSYEIIETQYAGHATEIAREAANRGVDVVCAVGGDGTVNETARALVHTETSLALIPCGSGNGLARHLHIPLDVARAVHLINEGKTQKIDYGIINLHPFFCTCGVGFDAFISEKFAKAGKRGPISYIENILRNGLRYHPETYELEVEDEFSHVATYKALLITCANASQYGNNAYIAPQASVRDGLMDVTIIEPFLLVEAPQLAMHLLNGTIDLSSHIKTFRCRHLLIKRKKAGVIHYDGDPIMADAALDISLVQGGLSCICPNDEGILDMGETIQNAILENFNNIALRSEDIFEKGLRWNPLISKKKGK